jgi:hypothetical protein
MTPFHPRPISFLGQTEARGYVFKLYSVTMEGKPFKLEDAYDGFQLVLRHLPQPAQALGRPGVGFCIFHWGNGADYVVLCWWDRENELPLRIALRTDDEPDWRLAQGSESFCVWDLQIIGFERDAYVQSILSEQPGKAEDYLQRVYASAK